MHKKTGKKVVNLIMLLSLIIVMTTGMLLRPMPGMWLGILHGISGMTLTISIVIHCFQHKARRKVAEHVS